MSYSGASPITLMLGLTAGLTGAFVLGWIAGGGTNGSAIFRTWFAISGFVALLVVNGAGIRAFDRQQRFVMTRSARLMRDRDRLRKNLESNTAELAAARAEIEKQRQNADQAYTFGDQFLMHMNHELRTPLNAIIGFATLMRDQVLGPLGRPRYVSYAGEIHDSGLRLLRLIEDVLDIADIKSGRRTIHPAVHNPEVVVRAAVESHSSEAARRKIHLAATLAADCPLLFADPAMIRRLLSSLLTNAIAFTPEGGRIDLRCDPAADSGVTIEIADTGPGMTAEEAQRAMDFVPPPDPLLKTSGRGFGLGLPLVRAMMDLHKGSAEIRGRPGQGTTVRLVFPPSPAPTVLTPLPPARSR